MKDFSTHDSQLIEFLRFPLTFLVVMQHCKGYIPPQQLWENFTLMDIYYAIKVLFSGGISFIAVPTFFFISGYLFFRRIENFNAQIYKKKIQRRLLTLGGPYLLWNLLCIPLVCIVKYFENYTHSPLFVVHEYISSINWAQVFWNHNTMEIGHPNLFGIHTLYSAPLLGTMWFVRDLIILAIFSLIIHWFLKRTKVYGLVIITALYLLRIWPPISLNLISVYFFSLGAYFSIIKKSLLIPKEITIPCVCIALLCLLFFIKNGNESYWGWQLIPLLNLSGVVSVISFAYIFIQKKSIPKYTRLLSDSSFFVYALHIEFTLPLGFFVIKAITFNSTAPLILIVRYFFTPIVIYALSIGIYIALKRTTPKILMLLTGLR